MSRALLPGVCLGLVLLAGSAAAQEPPPAGAPAPPPDDAPAATPAASVALSDALQVAVRQSPSLADAAIDVSVADAQLLAAAGLDDWLLSATGSFQRAYSSHRSGQNSTTTIDLQATLTRPLSTGGSLGVRAGGGWSDNPFAFSTTQVFRYSSRLSVVATQPLLRGAGRRIARADQYRARTARDAAERTRRAAAINVVQDVVAAYWELAYAARSLEIRRGALQLAEERLRRIQAGIAAGATAGIEEVAVSQTVATREQDVISSEVDLLTRSLALRRAAGMPIGPGELDLAPVTPLSIEPDALDFDALYARALAASPQLAVLEARAAGADIDVAVAEDAMRARLDASLNAGLNGVGRLPTGATKDLLVAGGWSVSAELDYSQTLGNRAARGSARRARDERNRIDVQIADTRAGIAQQLAQAVALARSAAQRAELSAKVVALAKQSIEAEKARERLGRSTSFDVAQREDEMAQAQLAQTRAEIDYLVAAAAVDALTGDILDHWGITLTPAR